MSQTYLMASQHTLYNRISKHMRINDTFSAFLAIFGIILAYFEYEDFYGSPIIYTDEDGNSTIELNSPQYTETSFNTTLRVIIGLSSIILCVTIVSHYKLKLQFLKLEQKLYAHETLCSTKLVYLMLLELTVCIIHCPPGFNRVFTFQQYNGTLEYSLDMFTFLFMFGRMYLMWRVFERYSSWNDQESQQICNSCLCEGGVKFAIKAELKERPYAVVIFVLFLSIMAFGLALRTAERPFMLYSKKDWDYVWNGMWCIIITMATVGYGDFYPTTHLGRLIDVIACFWGTFLVSLMVVSLAITSELTPHELKAYDSIKRREAKAELDAAAINTIKAALRLRLFSKKNPSSTEESKVEVLNKFKNTLIHYRTLKREMMAKEQDAPFEQILAKLHEKVSYGLEDIKSKCYIYKTLLARLDASEANQRAIRRNIESLDDNNLKVFKKLELLKKVKIFAPNQLDIRNTSSLHKNY